MQKIIIALAIFCLNFCAASAQETFNKLFDKDNQLEVLWSTLVSEDGYISYGATTDFTTGEGQMFLFKTDFLGDTLWLYSEYIPNHYFYSRNLLQIDDGIYALSSGISDITTSDSRFQINKFSNSGEFIWEKKFELGDEKDGARQMIQTSDGGFLLVGFSQNFPESLAQAYVVKTDSEGELEWQADYGSLDYPEVGVDVVQLQNGDYFIIGFRSYENGDKDALLYKINAEGELLWEKLFNTAYFDEPRSLTSLSDGNYLVTGASFNGVVWSSESDGWVFKIDTAGTVLWEQKLGSSNTPNDYESIRKAYEYPNGEIMLMGNTSSLTTPYHDSSGWLCKLSAEGDSLWSKFYSYADSLNNDFNEYFRDFKATPDGGFIICGFTGKGISGTQDAWLLKVDSLGDSCFPANCSSADIIDGIEDYNGNGISDLGSFSFYPNPSNGTINVKSLEPNSKLNIYSIQGSLVYSKALKLGDERIDLPLEAGTYFVQVVAKVEKGRNAQFGRLYLVGD